MASLIYRRKFSDKFDQQRWGLLRRADNVPPSAGGPAREEGRTPSDHRQMVYQQCSTTDLCRSAIVAPCRPVGGASIVRH